MVAKSIIGLFGNKIGSNANSAYATEDNPQQMLKSKTFRHASSNQLGDDDNKFSMDDINNTIGYYNAARNQISSTIED